MARATNRPTMADRTLTDLPMTDLAVLCVLLACAAAAWLLLRLCSALLPAPPARRQGPDGQS
jgi:hypothetical protein